MTKEPSCKEEAQRVIRERAVPPKLIVFESSSTAEIDFTAAEILLAFIEECRRLNITSAIARIESVRAQEAFERFGIVGSVPRDYFFHSVDEAIVAFSKKKNEIHQKPV